MAKGIVAGGKGGLGSQIVLKSSDFGNVMLRQKIFGLLLIV